MTDERDDERQRVVRVPGSRRAKLTPVPGSDGEPESVETAAPERKPAPRGGPNDERMLRDVPPHY